MRLARFSKMILMSCCHLTRAAPSLDSGAGADRPAQGGPSTGGQSSKPLVGEVRSARRSYLVHGLHLRSLPLPIIQDHSGRIGWFNRKRWGRGRVEGKYNTDHDDWKSLEREVRLERRAVTVPGVWVRTAVGVDYELTLDLEGHDVYAANYVSVDSAGEIVSDQPPDNVLVLRGHVRGRLADSEVLLSMTRSTCQVGRRGSAPASLLAL